MCATLLAEFAVGVERARIALQVARVVKLCGVEEYGNHSGSVILHAALDERGMTLVKRTHGWHQSNLFSFVANLEEFVLKVNN